MQDQHFLYSFLIKRALLHFSGRTPLFLNKAFIVKSFAASVFQNSLTCKIQQTALEIKLWSNTQTLRKRWQLPFFKEEDEDDEEELQCGVDNMEKWLKWPSVSESGQTHFGSREKKKRLHIFGWVGQGCSEFIKLCRGSSTPKGWEPLAKRHREHWPNADFLCK